MKTILVIDTSQKAGRLFLAKAGKMIFETQWENDRFTGEKLMGAVADALRRANIGLSDVDRVAVVAGPGGFGTVRTGIVTAMMLSEAASVDLVSISSDEGNRMLAAAQKASSATVITPVYET